MPQNPGRRRATDHAHPFLTAKGLRLQQTGRKDMPAPMALPSFPAGPRFAAPAPITDPFDFEDDKAAPIHNVLPSAKYPRPEVLGLSPLRDRFQSHLVASSGNTQLRAIGKLFIQLPAAANGDLAAGSAWISGPSTIVTSAHNLFDSNHRSWSRALEFHPGYDYYSSQALPTCRVTSCYVPRGYFDNPTTNHDIAVCYVDRNIGDIVGARIAMRPVEGNELFERAAVSIVGYPSTSDFDFGKQMWQSRGDYLFGRSNGPGDDYAPAMATNFGAGASGCPWLIKDDGKDEYVAVGVTSGHAKLRYLRGEPNLMSLTSPFFGQRMFDSLNDDPVYHTFQSAG